MATAKPTTTELVEAFVTAAREAGFAWSIRGTVVTITKSFEPGDADAFVAADGDGPSVLWLVPIVASGSVWGTDGGSVGGAAGLAQGTYRLNVSGVSKRFAAALAKVTA